MKTYDCPLTLADRRIIEFCRSGYLKLVRVVPGDVTGRICDHLNDLDLEQQPHELLDENWFVKGLVLNPQTTGTVRSLLRSDFQLPDFMANHRRKCPETKPLGWHVDGGNMHTNTLNYLQVFCLLQNITVEMGPTKLVLGSHFLLGQSALVSHYRAIKGSKK